MLVVKNTPASAGDIGNMGSLFGLGRSPRGGHSNSLQYSCLENAMDRGAWRATVHWAAKSQTQLKQLGMHRCISVCVCVCVCVSESLCCIAEIKPCKSTVFQYNFKNKNVNK